MSEYRKWAKDVKPMVDALKAMLGPQDAGMFLAICCDLLQDCVKGREQLNLRTIEIKINDYFSSKYDFEKEEIVEN